MMKLNSVSNHFSAKNNEKTNPQLNRCSLIFISQAGGDSVEIRVEDETVWLTQKLIAELFGKSTSTIYCY